jgi:lactoylglutathione lyase
MNTLVPELSVSNLDRSLHFYRDVIGFKIKFERPENRFAYMELFGSELMLEEDRARPGSDSVWIVEPLDYPRGRGLNISIACEDATTLAARITEAGFALRKPLEEHWYRDNKILHGERNFLVQDPDGFLLRFAQSLGTKPVGA